MNERRFPKLVLVSVAVLAICWTVLSGGGVSKAREPERVAAPHPVSGDPNSSGNASEASPFHSGIARPTEFVAWQSNLGGTCINCHTGISAPHAKQAIKCIDCHGGNDQVQTGPTPDIRDKALMEQAHVRPRESKFFWANGIDDKFAGKPGKGKTEFDAFNNNQDPVDNTNDTGTHIDAEFSRDLNYVRFINPSDYRVAMISCGSRSPAETSVGQCHGVEVTTIRKSIMTTNQAQFATATYANHSPQGATNMNPAGTNPTGRADPRDGEVCITFNYDDIDASYDPATNRFDGNRLRQLSLLDSDPFNDGFEAIGATLIDKDGQLRTATHGNDNLVNGFPTARLRGIGGKKIIPQAVPRAQKMILPWSRRDSLFNPEDPVSKLIKTVFDVFGETGTVAHHPVDAGFNGVRAFDPALFPDVNQNFPVPFDDNLPDRIGLAESRGTDAPVPNIEFVAANPFNRNRNSGCASCHMLYRPDGKNEEPFDATVRDNGRNPSTSPFTGMREDIGERGYPALHQLTTKIPTDQCGICHVFTTRVDVAFKGVFEIENNNFNFRWSTTSADPSFSATQRKIALQFTNRGGTRVNMFDNLATVDKNGTTVINPGERRTEDRNNNGILDQGEDRNGDGVLDIPDRLQRSDAQDGRQMRIMYGGATGAVRLQDIHLERGMECIDCHFFQDLHGDGNIYTRNWDAIEIECVDCHGSAKKLGTLRTSGPNGGNDLTQSFNEEGKPFLEILSDGSRIQRSRVRDGLQWRIPQVKEAITRGGPHFNQNAFDAMGVKSIANRKQFAHINEGRDQGKLECYTCHNAATPQCFACHYQQEYFPKPNPLNPKFNGQPRRNDEQMMEIWMGEKYVPFPNFFFFGIVRSPFVMGANGNTEFNKLSPFRSIMELNFSVAAPNGNTVVENTSFTATTHDLVTGDRPRSGSTLNPYMPHTVRLKETKDCDSCHTLRDTGGNIINNHLLAGSYGLGTGRYHDIGDWVFSPLQGPSPSLLLLDIKKEIEVIVNEVDAPQNPGDTQPPTNDQIVASRTPVDNVFPGFTVDKTRIRKVELTGVADGAPFVDPRDTALIRNYTARDHQIRGADLVFVADGAGGLKIALVTARDQAINESVRQALGPKVIQTVPTTNARGVDVISSDLSDEFVYVADGAAGAKVVRIHEVFTPPGATVVGQVDTPGFANKVKIAGNFLYVADGAAGLTVVNVTNPNNPQIVETVNTSGNALDVAVYGVFAFVANGNNGMAVIDISNELDPRLVTVFNAGGTINDARGIDYADNRAYIADGVNGLRILDITSPANPLHLATLNLGENGVPINDAESVALATIPFKTFAMVCDGANGLRAINVTDFRDIRERLFPGTSAFPANAADSVFQPNFNLSLALRDPLTPFDRANVKFAGGNVANPPFEIITFPVSAGQRLLRIARGRQLDKFAGEDGRTLRDSTSVGARALSRAEMDKMRAVNVVIQPGTADDKGNGLGNIVLQGSSLAASNYHDTETPHPAPPTSRASEVADTQAPESKHVRLEGWANLLLLTLVMGAVALRRYRQRR